MTTDKAEKEYLFVRSFRAEKGDHLITFISQPYVVGMYVSLEDSRQSQLAQLSFSHRDFIKWVNSMVKEFTKNEYVVEKKEDQYMRYLKEADFEEFVKPEIKKV